MDFLYADLNEIVDPLYYTYEDTDGTIKIDIDNLNRIIKANLVKLPHTFSAKVYESNTEKELTFDASQDLGIEVPAYTVEVFEKPDSTSPTGKSQYYQLMRYDFSTHQYEKVGKPIVGGGGAAVDINIENGWTTEQSLDSQKIGTGNAGISSVRYQNKDDEKTEYVATSYSAPENALTESDKIIGLKIGQDVHGGTRTGVQSIAFGGESFGLSKYAIIKFRDNRDVEKKIAKNYNIVKECPLTLLSAQTDGSIVVADGDTITITDINGSVLFDIHYEDEEKTKVLSLSVRDTELQNFISAEIARGSEQTPTAVGNQAVSAGGSTQANKSWSQAFGLETVTSREGQMAVGMYNKEEPNAMFVVGNGRLNTITMEQDRTNAFVVFDDNSVNAVLDNGFLE